MDVAALQIVIARHGNTFDPGDTVLRCGARTDLPLSVSGLRQASALGQALAQDFAEGFDATFVSSLQRTQQTARLALDVIDGVDVQPHDLDIESFLDEIDYGPDEGLPESAVLARLGCAALSAWDEQAIVPPGWHCDPHAMAIAWQAFLDRMSSSQMRRVLVVTSNGVARFALRQTRQGDGPLHASSGKLSTGAYGVLHYDKGEWRVSAWNRRPTIA